MKKISIKYFSLALALIFVGGGVYFYSHRAQPADLQIVKFDKNRPSDLAFIFSAFEHDRYWLTNNPEFSAEYMIEHMTPFKDPQFFGKERIVMLEHNGEPVAFGSYYMKNFYEGWVHFLYVAKDHRGHGYSLKLMRYMIEQIFLQGAKIVKVWTRLNNAPARALYKSKLGFYEAGDDGNGFMLYELRK